MTSAPKSVCATRRGALRRREALLAFASHSHALAKRPAQPNPAPAADLAPVPAIPTTLAGKLSDIFIQTTSSFFNGAVLGAFVGLVSGAWTTRSWVGARAEAGSAARSWGGISGVYTGLQAFVRAVRGKEDKYNAVIGACGSGAFFSLQAGPRAALQGCATFALFSYVLEMWSRPPTEPAPVTPDDALIRSKRS